MELLFELVYVATGEPRNGIQEMLEPTEAQERNEYLKRAGNVYRWERVRQPHRDRD